MNTIKQLRESYNNYVSDTEYANDYFSEDVPIMTFEEWLKKSEVIAEKTLDRIT